MKKIRCLLLCMVTVAFCCCKDQIVNVPDTNKPTNDKSVFSVGTERYVTFSKGNLQYRPSTKEWHFAEHQYDVYGRNAEGNMGSSDWIDLFAWGTGDNPMSVENNTHFQDWGRNQIGEDSPSKWRTLTRDEWNYLLFERLNSQASWGLAKVHNIQGFILLPDNFETTKNITFNSGCEEGFQTNVYTASEWEKMERAGAIFFPIYGSIGYYWSSTQKKYSNSYYKCYLECTSKGFSWDSSGYSEFCSVRLVQNL